MYYNRIFRVWVLDPMDYFLLSAIIGSLVGSYLKKYLSETQAMQRLKNSIIKKSLPDEAIRPYKQTKFSKLYTVALRVYGGQLLPADNVSNEIFKLAQEIKGFVEHIASVLKERELRGVAKIFFKNGRLILDLLLSKCRIDITYALLTEASTTQVIVITSTLGGIGGFSIAWLSVGSALVVPPLLISTFLIRSILQQIINQREYANFKRLINIMLDDDELKKTIKAVFMEGEVSKITPIEMKAFNSNTDYIPEFNRKSDQTFEEFIKDRMKEELGLIENPTSEEIQQIIERRNIKPKPKGKTVLFKDFIDKIGSNSEDLDIDIIDAEIVKKPLRVQVRNEEL